MQLGRKTWAIDEHKHLLMIVSSREVKQVDAVMQVAKKAYSAQSFTEQEMELGLLFLQLGGTWLASIAHNAFGTPLSPHFGTIDQQSHSVSQLGSQLLMNFTIITEQPSNVHGAYILMFDKIKIEEVSRYDPSMNHIVGKWVLGNPFLSVLIDDLESSTSSLELLTESWDLAVNGSLLQRILGACYVSIPCMDV
ncbi:uncharacterized protein EI90DRAFT_3012520 [Cantharellus anzutake]|uniref:uncharacterized protein n=1 Tax=Cantharellus anzutake TaxID=1750568 RepID=UPI0019065031|nr:uncharacterized protein EI90DRAFT_3012520 [Cantharellus anzutake]KAF8340755.1 hypothetical protein EI90DRAFT_3012520 [Cantharellus anzutake]